MPVALADYIGMYALSADLKPSSVEQLRYAVLGLDRWAAGLPDGRAVRLNDLSDDLLNRWLTYLLTSGMARATIKNRRGAIVTLWRAASLAGLVATWPKRVKSIRAPETIPQAWSRIQVEAILAAVAGVHGDFPSGVPRRGLLRGWFLAGWSTGMRPCDLLALRRRDVTADGSIAILQQKTGWPLLCRLTPEAMAAVEATFPPARELLFPINIEILQYWIGKLCNASGLPGSPKWLRRSGATAVEDQQPGGAQQYLGQKTPGLAWKHYIDPRLLKNKQHRPPPPLTG